MSVRRSSGFWGNRRPSSERARHRSCSCIRRPGPTQDRTAPRRPQAGIGWQTELRLEHETGPGCGSKPPSLITSTDPDVRGIVANLHDITARKRAEEALREAHERFRSAFENAPIGMVMADLDGSSPAPTPPSGGSSVGTSATSAARRPRIFTHPDDRELSKSEWTASSPAGPTAIGWRSVTAMPTAMTSGSSFNVSCVRDDDQKPLYFIGQIEDITESRALREQLAYAAIHDPLTSLPNRELFMDRLKVALGRAARGRHHVAVIFVDLDRFKLINDSLGHDVGDRILCAVADRLNGAMRASDTLARFGGDEFTVLCDDLDDEAARSRWRRGS